MNYCSKNQAIKCNFQSIDLAITDARSNLLDSLRFANACGALVAASSGVLAALPEMRQVSDFMQHAMN